MVALIKALAQSTRSIEVSGRESRRVGEYGSVAALVGLGVLATLVEFVAPRREA